MGLPGCLQWRYSDKDLRQVFEARTLPLAIHHIQVAGSNLRYVEIRGPEADETAAKPNILLIHGAPSSLRVWTGYLTDTALLKVANLYAVDRPGYGFSDFGKPDTSIMHQVEVMEAVLRRHAGPWVLFGSSYGGPIAAVLAARNPGRVKAVLLTSPALAPGEEKIYKISYTIKRPAFGWFFPVIFRVANAEKLSHRAQLSSIAHYYGEVTQPVTYIHGAQDHLIYPINAAYARAHFTKAHLKVIRLEDESHFFTFTKQGLNTQELVALLDYARPPRTVQEEARREEAADSGRVGERLPYRPMPGR